MHLKVEINSREHFAVHGFIREHFAVSTRWFSGHCEINTFTLDELLATKLRALYQRKKGRDLFDLAIALGGKGINTDRVIAAFLEYMARGGDRVSRAQFEQNLHAKLRDPRFDADIGTLLAAGFQWDREAAAEAVRAQLVARLPGEPWQGSEQE